MLIVWGPDADRRAKLLIHLAVEGALLGAYSHLTPLHATRGPPRPALLRYVGLRDAGLGSIRGVILGREKGSHLDAI